MPDTNNKTGSEVSIVLLLLAVEHGSQLIQKLVSKIQNVPL